MPSTGVTAIPRNGSGVYSKPAGTTAVANTTIESAKYNSTIDDLVADANNARPVTAGGTGATSKSGATTSLEAVSYGAAQTLTTAQKSQALSNIGALWEKIGEYTLSGASVLDITDLSDFDMIRILISIQSSITTGLALRTSTDNGATFSSGASDYINVTAPGAVESAGAQISLTSVSMTASSRWSIDSVLDGFNKPFTTKIMGRACGTSGGTFAYVVNAGYRASSTPRDALRIFPGSGGTITGTVYVEGIRG